LHPGHYWEGIHADLVAVVDPTGAPPGVQRKGGPQGPPPGAHS
jgi:hypothetical protein